MLYDWCSEARAILVVDRDTMTVVKVMISLIMLFVIVFDILRIEVEDSL